uniref:Transcriptional regulator, TraR/DksA family n=1 Tax=Solibacter usitatus (strain Ellin6076) TaxID=234267 RepID=Q01TC0_SOLUE
MSGPPSIDRLARGDVVNVEHFKEKLLSKRRELVDAIGRAEQEVRTASEGEVGDPLDRSVDDTAADEGLHNSSVDSETLQQVDDALRRIEQGSYGKCVICGKPIEPARLEAIPWTPYCKADQERLETVKGPGSTPTL